MSQESPRIHTHPDAVNFSDLAIAIIGQRPMRTEVEKMEALMAANFAGQLMQIAVHMDDGVSPDDISYFVEKKKEALLATLPPDKNTRTHFFRSFEKIKNILTEAMNHAINGTVPKSPHRS